MGANSGLAVSPIAGRLSSNWREVIDWRTCQHKQGGMRAVSVQYLEPEHLANRDEVSRTRTSFDIESAAMPAGELPQTAFAGDLSGSNLSSSEGFDWASPRLVAQLVARHSKYVWCLLRRLGVSPSQLDDATQQVFIVAARRLEDVVDGRERSFLCGTAVRVASNCRRSENAQISRHSEAGLDEIQSNQPNGEALLEQMQARRMLDKVLEALTEELRAVFVLCEIEGLTAPEVAAIVEVPLGTVSSRLRRAREQFRLEAARLREAFLAGDTF